MDYQISDIRYIVKSGNKLLFKRVADRLAFLDTPPEYISRAGEEFLIQSKEYRYIAYETDSELLDLPNGYVWYGLREAYSFIDSSDYSCAAKALELLYWDAGSKFCGRCGSSMQRSTDISKKCTACANEIFAQVSPAVIVLVRRGREALLVHARNFTRPVFGLVAGFVETGESLEECVAREVLEETSLSVRNISYVASQAWPYPNSLMLAFTADYASGELAFADGELTAGGFFTPENLPQLPPHPSIARSLIEAWLEETRHNYT